MPRSAAEISRSDYPPLTAEFRRRTAATFGPDGRRWLEELPAILRTSESRWQLQIDLPFEGLSYNYVAPATAFNGQEIIFKCGVPRTELVDEASALMAYDGCGSVRLLEADPHAGILLLERAAPGRMLSDFGAAHDEEATRIAAQVMKRLWRPTSSGHQFQNVADWARGFQRLHDHFHGGTGPFPSGLVAEAETIYERNLATTEREYLLHGDLHHYNILSAGREPWLAIDPKGIVGDPAYEAGALLRNPIRDLLSWSDLDRIQSRRLDILSDELQIVRRRIQDWAFAQAVLSAWWSFEDDGAPGAEWILLAEQIRAA